MASRNAEFWQIQLLNLLLFANIYTYMRLGPDGTIAVPPEYQKELGWKPGDEVEFEVASGALVVRHLAPDEPATGDIISNLRGRGRLKLPTDEVMRLLRSAE